MLPDSAPAASRQTTSTRPRYADFGDLFPNRLQLVESLDGQRVGHEAAAVAGLNLLLDVPGDSYGLPVEVLLQIFKLTDCFYW